LKASLLPVVRERHRELDRVAASQLCGDADNILNPHSPDNALSFGAACAIQI